MLATATTTFLAAGPKPATQEAKEPEGGGTGKEGNGGEGIGRKETGGTAPPPAEAAAPPPADPVEPAAPASPPSGPSAPSGPPASPDEAERLEKARNLLQEAIRRSQAQGPAPAPGGLRPFPGMRVDKYFGTKLPPVCASLGCYVTDDGKRFYCVNPACQKHKKRETKHTRRGNPAKAHFVYFRCPRCESRSLEMHVLSNRYVCRACKYSWQR